MDLPHFFHLYGDLIDDSSDFFHLHQPINKSRIHQCPQLLLLLLLIHILEVTVVHTLLKKLSMNPSWLTVTATSSSVCEAAYEDESVFE